MTKKQLAIHIIASAAVIAILFFGTIFALSLIATNRTEDTCLANKLDRYWTGSIESKTKRPWQIWRRNVDGRTAKAQAETMARIFIKQAGQKNESLCPPDWWRWGWHTAWREIVGSRGESARWKYLYIIAQNARRGDYKIRVQKEHECAEDFKPTWLSLSPRLSLDAKKRHLHPVGKIGGMTLYCPDEGK